MFAAVAFGAIRDENLSGTDGHRPRALENSLEAIAVTQPEVSPVRPVAMGKLSRRPSASTACFHRFAAGGRQRLGSHRNLRGGIREASGLAARGNLHPGERSRGKREKKGGGGKLKRARLELQVIGIDLKPTTACPMHFCWPIFPYVT